MILTSACIIWAKVRTSPRAWQSHPLSWMPGWHLVPLWDLKLPMAPDVTWSKDIKRGFLPANKKWALICGQLYSYKILQDVARVISLAADRSRACIKGSSCVWSLEIEIWFALWFGFGTVECGKSKHMSCMFMVEFPQNAHSLRIAPTCSTCYPP